MRGVLIDPWLRKVLEVDVAETEPYSDNEDSLFNLVGCPLIDGIRLDKHLHIWFEDRKKARKKVPPPPVFWLAGQEKPIIGRALLLGLDTEGENMETMIPCRYVKGLVEWEEWEKRIPRDLMPPPSCNLDFSQENEEELKELN
jgi:hypothetical protein